MKPEGKEFEKPKKRYLKMVVCAMIILGVLFNLMGFGVGAQIGLGADNVALEAKNIPCMVLATSS